MPAGASTADVISPWSVPQLTVTWAVFQRTVNGRGDPRGWGLPRVWASATTALVNAQRGSAAGASSCVLVVDDEGELRSLLRETLERDGFRVVEAPDGETALQRIASLSPDLVLLDLGLGAARMSGLEVLRHVRAAGSLPVIVLSGRSEETDRVLGLELGADDYVVKPFSARELVARVRAVLRRDSRNEATAAIVAGDLTLDVDTREVTCRGNPIELTAREFALLAFLAVSPRQVFSADQLLQHVWGSDPAWQRSSTVSEHIYRLRRKIEEDAARPKLIITVRGVGYRFVPEESSPAEVPLPEAVG
jgi:two-component system, OmpR family, phosphate regulon response regulator PhoB